MRCNSCPWPMCKARVSHALNYISRYAPPYAKEHGHLRMIFSDISTDPSHRSRLTRTASDAVITDLKPAISIAGQQAAHRMSISIDVQQRNDCPLHRFKMRPISKLRLLCLQRLHHSSVLTSTFRKFRNAFLDYIAARNKIIIHHQSTQHHARLSLVSSDAYHQEQDLL